MNHQESEGNKGHLQRQARRGAHYSPQRWKDPLLTLRGITFQETHLCPEFERRRPKEVTAWAFVL
jgi:hypothetical protein